MKTLHRLWLVGERRSCTLRQTTDAHRHPRDDSCIIVKLGAVDTGVVANWESLPVKVFGCGDKLGGSFDK